MRKGWIFIFVAAAALSARAEPTRPFLTRENRLPELHQLELGLAVEHREITASASEDDFLSVVPQFRYGLARELTLNAALPHVTRSPAVGDSESGFGDARIGLTLRAWEDIFGFPYLIPYAEAAFPMNKDKLLGEADPWYVVGIAIGTTVYDRLHYALDAGYRMFSEEDNVGVFRGSLTYDLSKKTSILVEGEFTTPRSDEEDDRQLVLAGLTYKPTRDWIVGFYGGSQINGENDGFAAMKVSRSFRPFVF